LYILCEKVAELLQIDVEKNEKYPEKQQKKGYVSFYGRY
jgi:hypothetical protein